VTKFRSSGDITSIRVKDILKMICLCSRLIAWKIVTLVNDSDHVACKIPSNNNRPVKPQFLLLVFYKIIVMRIRVT